jgi:anti-sigma B factor antagonist
VAESEPSVTVDSGGLSPEGWPVLRIAGEIDIQTSPLFEEQLLSVLNQGNDSLVVDLGEVTFLDSTGLSVLIAGLKLCQDAGGELHVVSPRPNVLRVLEITGLTEAFHLEG